MLNQRGEKPSQLADVLPSISCYQEMYFVFSSLILTNAFVVCCFNGTFIAAYGYGGSLKMLHPEQASQGSK